jgi:hypothetical protein
MVAPIGTKLPYDGQKPIKTPAGARVLDANEIHEIKTSQSSPLSNGVGGQAASATTASRIRQMAQSLYGAAKSGFATMSSFIAPLPEQAVPGTQDKPASSTTSQEAPAATNQPASSTTSQEAPAATNQPASSTTSQEAPAATNQPASSTASQEAPAAAGQAGSAPWASRAYNAFSNFFAAFASMFKKAEEGTAGETQAGENDPVTKFLNSEVESLGKEQKITLPALNKEQAATYQKALNQAKEFLNNGDEVDLPAIVEHLLKVRQNISSSAATAGQPPASASQTPAAGESAATGSQAPQAGEGTPETGGAESPSGKPAVEGATAPKAANDDTKTETKKPETENKTNTAQKEEQNWKNGYIGWKAGIGAALLAGGIALKMTIIGIIPGLIMAGAGAALMGWGGINYCMKDNK